MLTKRYDGYVSWFQYMMRIYILICYIKRTRVCLFGLNFVFFLIL